MDSVNLLFNVQPTVSLILKLVAAHAILDFFHNQLNAFPKFHVSKTVSPRMAFATAMMDFF